MADEAVVETVSTESSESVDTGVDAVVEADDSTGADTVVEADDSTGADTVDAGETVDSTPAPGAAKEPAADPWQGISWRHRQAAERAKRDPAWAKAVGPEVLDGLASSFDEMGRKFAVLGRGPGDVAPAEAPKPAKTEKPVAGESAGEFGFDLASAYPEGVDEAFEKSVLQPVAKQFNTLSNRLQQAEQVIQQFRQLQEQTQAERAIQSVDTFVQDPQMGEFAEVYGNGRSGDLDPNGSQVKARADLYATARLMFIGAQKAGQPISEAEAFKWAHSVLNGDKIAASEREKGRKEAEAQKKKAIHRPAGRVSPTPAPTADKAEEEARSLWRRGYEALTGHK